MSVHMLVSLTLLPAWSLPSQPLSGAIAARSPPMRPLRMDVMEEGVDLEAAANALSFFLDDSKAVITPTSGGVNNYVLYVDTTEGERFVLRMYNNGGETERVRYEHSVLEQMERAGLTAQLPFKLPKYLPSLATGATMVEMPDGNQACLCELIEGGLPKTADPRLLGRAVGQLMTAMGQLDLSKVEGEECDPYYDIYKAHPITNRENFYEYAAGPELDVCREAMETMVQEFKVCDAFIEAGLRKGLPEQVIHGDLHYDNVLCDEGTGEVTGLLDFEFCGNDWRAIEVAVCLSKYVGEEDPFPLVESFIDGFCETGSLTPDEVEGLPDMINMRVMSNAIYFVGRAIANEDTIRSLTKRADTYAQRMVWVRDNRERIVQCVKARMSQKSGRVVPTCAVEPAPPVGFEWGIVA